MAQKPNPRILPKVTYSPPQEEPPTGNAGSDWRKKPMGDVLADWGGVLNQTGNSNYSNGVRIDNFPQAPAPQAPQTNPVPSWLTGAGAGNYADARAQEVAGGAPQYIQDAFRDYYQQNQGGASVTTPNAGQNVPGAPAGADNPLGAGVNNPNEPGPMPNQYNRLQDAVQKNQSLTEKATAAGDDKEMKRLDDEWARLTSTPQFKAMYGSSDPMQLKERLINSYMQPGNDAAESSMDRAGGRMIADDVWAQAFQAATGGPPSQIHWDEHWSAMNKGGRDPLEGHPMAVQAIQAKMKEMEQANQQASYDSLQKWFTNSNPL
jgi:hypothetical protein